MQLKTDEAMEFGSNYVKFGNGLLLCFGKITAAAGNNKATFTFPIPFKDTTYVTVAVHSWATENRGTCTLGASTNEYTDILIYDHTKGITAARGAQVLCIGRWK